MTYNARKYSLAGSWGIYTVCQLPIDTADSVTSRFLEMSTGTGKGRVPWAKLQRAQGDYIEAKYLPEEVALKQYYHLRQEDVNAILGHWAKRQSDGKVPLLFKKAVRATCHNVHISEGNGSDSDRGPSKEEQNLQDSNGSQAEGGRQSRGDSRSSFPPTFLMGLSLMTHRQVKLMGGVPKMGGMALAPLHKGPYSMTR